MAKNYANIYNGGNDSVAPNQRFYITQEAIRGTMEAPANENFLFTLNGGTISFTQSVMQSEHRSDRHNTSFIKEKKATEWSFNTYVNIDTDVVAGATEIDGAMRVLWKSLLGREQVSSGLIYDSAIDPSITFTLMEVGDHWAKQAPAAWVDTCNANFPGDGQSQLEWAGRAATSYMVGISKSAVDNTGGNTFTADVAGEARRAPVGALVMFVALDGVTRLEGTDLAPRTVTATDPLTGIITVDGAAFIDMDGVEAAFLVYWEPETPTAINNPITGLVGSVTLDTLSVSCVRSLSVSINNQHEAVDYCYGTDALASPYFVPADRLLVEVSMEVNLNASLVEFYNRVLAFEGHNLDVDLGNIASRHLHLDLPYVVFSIPEVSVPDSGSIPVTFDGTAYQSALGAADELTVSYL